MFPWYLSLIFLKRSLVFPILLFSLFLCIDRWGGLSYLFLLLFGTLHSNGYIFPFLFCFLKYWKGFNFISHSTILLFKILRPYCSCFLPWWRRDVLSLKVTSAHSSFLLSCVDFSGSSFRRYVCAGILSCKQQNSVQLVKQKRILLMNK